MRRQICACAVSYQLCCLTPRAAVVSADRDSTVHRIDPLPGRTLWPRAPAAERNAAIQYAWRRFYGGLPQLKVLLNKYV